MTLDTTDKILIEPTVKSLGISARKRKPIPEYKDFRFRAEVDWIEVKICTKKPSNFQTVKARLEAPYVVTLNEGSGGAATEFWIKFYSPINWLEIDRALEKFTHDHPLVHPVEVTGVEIALDGYSKRNEREAIAELTSQFYRGLTYLVSENQRITPGTSWKTEAIPSPKKLLRKIEQGENIYIGNKKPKEDIGDPHSWMMQHLYLKETDKNGPLPIEEHRARVEITLRGLALPHKLLEEWKLHNFASGESK